MSSPFQQQFSAKSPLLEKATKKRYRKSEKVVSKLNKAIEIDSKKEYNEDGTLTKKGKRQERRADRKRASAKKIHDKLYD
jgi:hypothetical protein